VSGTPKLIIAGNVTLDDVVHPDGTTSMGAVGGNSLYAGLGAGLWTREAGVVTRLGEDVVDAGRRELARAGLADGTTAIPGPAVRNWVLYEADGTRRYVHRTPPGRYLEIALEPGDIPDAWLAGARVVHLAAMPLRAAEALVDRVRAAAPQAAITLDTHEDWAGDLRARVLHLAGRVDCFVPSSEELAGLVGYDDPARAIAELAARDDAPPILVVKLGADGCLVWQRGAESAMHVGALPADVVDVTGAGDAFCGGLAAGLAAGLDPVQAACRGAVSAAFAIEGFGSLRLAEVDPAQAKTRLASAPGVLGVPISANGHGDHRSIGIMRGEIDGIPTLLERQLSDLAGPVADAARALDGVEEILLVGCGDSYFAGRAAELAFECGAGIRATAVHAMELARYRVRYLRGNVGVIPVSYSGRVGRTVEAAIQARRFGHTTLALTGRADGPLADACDASLILQVPSLGFSPGTNTYAGMVLALLQLAAALAERRDRDAGQLRHDLERLPGAARRTLADAAEPAHAIARRLAAARWLCFIGAGPSEASARFGAAKLFEGAQMLGTWSNLEEWAHEEYFVSGPGTPVVVVAPAGASHDRALEILSELEFIGADRILVSDAPGAELPFAPGLPEHVSPVLAALPLSLLGFFLADARGKRSYNFASAEAEREHYDTIHRATVGEPA
jgi:sugar/nucleoside kinase (ribokinase family)/fructoselysine-6-P-deglycase FrlB-like protein